MRKHGALYPDWTQIESAFETHMRILNDINEECERGRRADFEDVFPGNTHEEEREDEFRLHADTKTVVGGGRS